jgi:hypothetical protein
MAHRPLVIVLGLLIPSVALRAQDHTTHDHAAMSARDAGSDSSYAAMQKRGKEAMGVDQYTSAHRFDDAPDGGRIVLRRDAGDSTGVGIIRQHLATIAREFSAGNFEVPGFVHATAVPGTAIMRRRHADIAYEFQPLPGGGQVVIRTRAAEAVRAVHAFLAFQRNEHHAPGTAL